MKLIGYLIVAVALTSNLATFPQQSKIEILVSELPYPNEATEYNTSTFATMYIENPKMEIPQLQERLQQIAALNKKHYERYPKLKETLYSSNFSQQTKVIFDIDEASDEEWVPFDSTKCIYPISKIIILLG